MMAPAHETRVLVAFDAPTMPSQIKVSQTHKITRCLLNMHGVGVEIEIHMDTCCDVGSLDDIFQSKMKLAFHPKPTIPSLNYKGYYTHSINVNKSQDALRKYVVYLSIWHHYQNGKPSVHWTK